jgi:hypothetical protein
MCSPISPVCAEPAGVTIAAVTATADHVAFAFGRDAKEKKCPNS